MIGDQPGSKIRVRRLFVVMIRTSYRWICNHPFLLGFVGFMYLLHITCPLLFSLLLSASPVLVCTLVLLGTILSFGEPNIPEIEKEPDTTNVFHEAAPFRAEVSREAAIVVESGDNSFTAERFVSTSDKEGVDAAGKSHMSEVEDVGRSFDYRPLLDETLDEIKRDTHVRFEEVSFVSDSEKRGDRVVEKAFENAEWSAENGGSKDDSKDDQIDLSPVSPWRPMRHEEDEDDDGDRDDSFDSGSDGAESSSPDASMTDIIPMLDELHPLLHIESSSRGVADGGESDAASEGPHRSSSDEGMESDVDSESHGEEGDNEKEEEEEEKKEKKEDESKSAIKWTEADQKNVMDLGSLELERNQRLENLIARRRARHNMRVMAERNLIDFDSADVPFNMPPISTARQNPFDYPYDTYDDMGLPPIPGSAPSIMLARRNPFDLPYEPNEEKPDLKGDEFEQEFPSPQPKDPVFQRHQSFSVGPSMLGGARHDRLRPFFVLERLATEGTSHYPFERQLSEVSESKVSSVPDTESVCTVLEDDEKKVDEPDAAIVDTASDHEEEKSHTASDHDEERSHPSEDSDSDEEADNRNIHHDVPEIVLGSAETHHEQSTTMEGETSDKRKHDEEDSTDSDSSLSEKEEELPDISENEAILISEQKVDLHGEGIHVARRLDDDYHRDEASAEDSFITACPSLEESALHDLCGLVDDHHIEPRFDTSPPSSTRFPSFSSVSSDYKPGEEVQANAEKERDVFSETHSSYDETETSTREVGETSTHVPSYLPLDKNENADHQELHEDVKETVDTRGKEVSTSLSDLVPPTEEEVVSKGMVEQHLPVEHTEHVTTRGESSDVVHGVAESSVNRSVAEVTMHDEEDDLKKRDETFNSDIPIDSFATLSSGAVEYVETHSFNDEDVPQSEQGPVQSSVSDVEEETHPNQTMDIEVDSVNASAQDVRSEDSTPSESDRELTWSDKSVVEQSSREPSDDQVPTRAGPVSVVFSRNITFHEYHDAPEDAAELSCLTSDTSSTQADSPEYTTPMVGEGSGTDFFEEAIYDELDHVVERLDELTDLHTISQSPPEVITEEADEIKEIDEGLLSELDTVGDFSVKEVVTDTEPGPSSIGLETTDELTETLPVLEARSVDDIESALQQIHEGSEVDDVILPSTVHDQLAQESYRDSTEPESDLAAVEATSKEDLDNVMKQAVVENMVKRPESSESDGGLGEIKVAVETEQSEYSVAERSLDETCVSVSSRPDKEEEESRAKEMTTSGLAVMEATSKEDLDNAMNQAVEESMGKQPKVVAVETEQPEYPGEERSFDETNVPLNNTPEKEKEEESRAKETTTSDVPSIETRSLEEVPSSSEPKEEVAMEVISEREVIPTEDIGIGSSNVTARSDDVVSEEAKAEKAVANVQAPESKETPEKSGESNAEQKEKTEKKQKKDKKKKGKSDSSSSSSSSSSSDSD